MKDKTVIITGASSGIGLATARELARQGAMVALVCRDAERAEAARKEVAAVAAGRAPTVFLADLSSQREIRRLAAEIKENHAQIDVLINNAGAVFARLFPGCRRRESFLSTSETVPAAHPCCCQTASASVLEKGN